MAVLTLLSGSAAVPELSPDVREHLERLLEDRVRSLASEKNQWGYFSRDYLEHGDGIYRTIFHVGTATDGVLITERYRLTLGEGGGGSWEVTEEELEDTYRGVGRTVPGDEEFHSFGAFSLDLEGLEIRASEGCLYTDARDGQVIQLVLMGQGLAYEYSPPRKRDQTRHSILVEKHRDDLVIEPERTTIFCDPRTCENILTTAFENLRPSSPEDCDPALLEFHREWVREETRRRAEDPFFGFQPPIDPDRKQIRLILENRKANRQVSMVYDTQSVRTVTYSASELGAVHSYHSSGALSTAKEKDLDRRPNARASDFTLERIEGTVELGFGYGQRFTADLAYTIIARRRLEVLPFDLVRIDDVDYGPEEATNPRLRVDSLRDGKGRDLTWVKTGPASGLIVLAEPIPAGEQAQISMNYEYKDCIRKLTTNYYDLPRSGWLPLVVPGRTINTLDLTIKVPDRFEVLGIGTKVEESMNKGIASSRWTAESVRLASVYFGGFEQALSERQVSTASGRAIPVEAHLNKDATPVARVGGLEGVANAAANSVELFQRIFGSDYPFGKLDLVNVPASDLYGVAPVSTIFYGSTQGAQRGTGQMTSAEVHRFSRALIPHEVAHQWWGELVASANRHHQWFEEALAEYSAALFFQAASGLEDYLALVGDWRKEAIENEMLASVQDAHTLYTGGFRGYHAAVYAKGPYLFHMMRSMWGDERLLAVLKRLAGEFAGQDIVTYDIQRISEEVFGEPMDWFFDQWVRGIGIPELTFTYGTQKQEDGTYVIGGTIEQQVLASPRLRPKRILEGEFFECVVYLTMEGKGGKEYQWRIDVKGEITPFRVTVPEKPGGIRLNKYGETLAHDLITIEKPR